MSGTAKPKVSGTATHCARHNQEVKVESLGPCWFRSGPRAEKVPGILYVSLGDGELTVRKAKEFEAMFKPV